jgi:hypothetical protein
MHAQRAGVRPRSADVCDLNSHLARTSVGGSWLRHASRRNRLGSLVSHFGACRSGTSAARIGRHRRGFAHAPVRPLERHRSWAGSRFEYRRRRHLWPYPLPPSSDVRISGNWPIRTRFTDRCFRDWEIHSRGFGSRDPQPVPPTVSYARHDLQESLAGSEHRKFVR